MLVATPGRLQDLSTAGSSRVDGRRASSFSTRPTACSTWASSRRSSGSSARLPRDRQTMLFSATLDGEVGELARAYTRNPSRFEADAAEPRRVTARSTTSSSAVTRGRTSSTRLIAELEADRGLALVFVRTKRGADRLAEKLARRDVAAVAMHGDMSQRARERALERFRDGQGEDARRHRRRRPRPRPRPTSRHVINFDPPDDDKSYVHRVGRTGRAGRSGNGITLVLPSSRRTSAAWRRGSATRSSSSARGCRSRGRGRSTRAAAGAGLAGKTRACGRRRGATADPALWRRRRPGFRRVKCAVDGLAPLDDLHPVIVWITDEADP